MELAGRNITAIRDWRRLLSSPFEKMTSDSGLGATPFPVTQNATLGEFRHMLFSKGLTDISQYVLNGLYDGDA